MVGKSICRGLVFSLRNNVTYSDYEALRGAVSLKPAYREHVRAKQLQNPALQKGDDTARALFTWILPKKESYRTR